MKKILFVLILLSIFSINVIAIDIDIGNPAIDDIGIMNSGFTFIDLNNPANASGKINSVEILPRMVAGSTMYDVEVATFYLVSGTNYSTRDTHFIGTVTEGAKRTFEVDLNVQEGDFIGIYFSAGQLEAGAELGSAKYRYDSGNKIPCTDNNFGNTGERLISLYGTGATVAVDIDIGMPATDRGSSLTGLRTAINKGNPANAAGTITTVEVFAYTDMTLAEVATFFVVSGNKLSTRDTEAIGTVTAGATRTFEVNLDVQVGDYIGIKWQSGAIERDVSGGEGVWYTASDQIPCTNYEFSLGVTWVASLYGYGAAVGWDHKWNTKTISKWNTKEIIKWNGLE